MKRDWFDEVAVERAVRGYPVGRRLSSAEFREAVRLLARAEWGDTAISRHLDLSHTAVRYHRRKASA